MTLKYCIIVIKGGSNHCNLRVCCCCTTSPLLLKAGQRCLLVVVLSGSRLGPIHIEDRGDLGGGPFAAAACFFFRFVTLGFAMLAEGLLGGSSAAGFSLRETGCCNLVIAEDDEEARRSS